MAIQMSNFDNFDINQMSSKFGHFVSNFYYIEPLHPYYTMPKMSKDTFLGHPK